MQTLRLTYAENIATETLALIFVSTEVKADGKTYDRYGRKIVAENKTYNDAE